MVRAWSQQVLEAFSELLPLALPVSMSASADDIANTLDAAPLSVFAVPNYTDHLEPSSHPAPPEGRPQGTSRAHTGAVPTTSTSHDHSLPHV